MKTLTDINNKLDSLDIDKENIRQAIITQGVSVDISESISTYGDHIRMINPDIRLQYIYAYAYQTGDSPYPDNDIVWDSSNMLMDLGMKISDFTDNSLVINTGIMTSSIQYHDPPAIRWPSPKYCPIFTTKPYISQYYPDYYLNYFNLEARMTETPAHIDQTEYLLYTFPSVNPRTYPDIHKGWNAPDISKIDPTNSILMPYRVASPDYFDDELEITLKTNSIKADFNNDYHDTEQVNSVSRVTPVSSTIGDSLTAYNPNNMDTIKLDLGPGFILKDYFSSYPRKVRGGRSQKFHYIIVKDAHNREIKRIVPFLRYNPSTKVYDTIILKDIHNENDNGIVVPYPYLYRNGQWVQMTQGKTYDNTVYFKFYYK